MSRATIQTTALAAIIVAGMPDSAAAAGAGADKRRDKGPCSIEIGVESPCMKELKKHLKNGKWVPCRSEKTMRSLVMIRRGKDGRYECLRPAQ